MTRIAFRMGNLCYQRKTKGKSAKTARPADFYAGVLASPTLPNIL
ncbi:hypothetical protein Z949_2394 [Sulfitobacter guttiformis KCTC 32187]|nr:hypothetical protein Z949_2394 [Sulfitobacter guttiformis KCTC 32187]